MSNAHFNFDRNSGINEEYCWKNKESKGKTSFLVIISSSQTHTKNVLNIIAERKRSIRCAHHIKISRESFIMKYQIRLKNRNETACADDAVHSISIKYRVFSMCYKLHNYISTSTLLLSIIRVKKASQLSSVND